MKKKNKGKHPPTDTGVTTGKRLRWIRAKEYKLADDATLQKILNPPPQSGPEFKADEYINGVVNDSRLLYKCHEPDCGALFTSEVILRIHSNKHLNPNLKCTFCGRLSKNEDEFSQHCKEFHPDLRKTPGANPLKCIKCNKISRDVTALWRHIRESHRTKSYPCPYCEFPFTRPENLKVHIKFKHFSEEGEKEPPKFKCKICEKEFGYQTTLRGHIRKEHRGKHKKPEKRFQCKICNSYYSCKTTYTFHLRQHTNPTFFPCKICNITFMTQGKLNRHNECKSHLQNAKRAKGKPEAPLIEKTPVIKTVKSINPNLSKEQLIELCKKSVVKIELKRVDEFVIRRPLPLPKGSFTSESDNDDESTYTYLNCCYCDKALPNLETVKSHEINCYMKIRNRKINVCAICDKEFAKPYLLKKHTQRHINPNERPYKCSHCDATFKRRTSKKAHEKKFHFGIFKTYQRRKHKCEECGKVYSNITSYKHHRDAVHIGIRYTCKECGKVFRRTDHFQKHIKKDHQCPLRLECKHCNRSYVDKKSYLNHLLKPRHLRKVKQFERMVQKEKLTVEERTD